MESLLLPVVVSVNQLVSTIPISLDLKGFL